MTTYTILAQGSLKNTQHHVIRHEGEFARPVSLGYFNSKRKAQKYIDKLMTR